MMGSHPTWCFVVALSVLCSGTKVPPRQVVYQIRPAPLSAFTSQDGTFLLEDGVTEFQFPTFGLKTQQQAKTINVYPTDIVTSPASNLSNDSGDVDSSSSSSSSSSPSEEGSSSVTNEEITEVPRFGTSQVNQGQQFIQLRPEQVHQLLQQIQPQQVQVPRIELQQQQQQQFQQQQQQQQQIQSVDIGPRYEFRSEESKGVVEDIKTAGSEVITEDKLQPAYSERRERRKKNKEPPGDASYAFGYETEEAARHEVADPDGNVKGWYTYVDDEGTVRKIIYTAGAGKGFVILGKEKVRGPKPQTQTKRSRSRSANSDFLGFAADTSVGNSVKHQKPSTTPASFTNYVSFNSWNDLAKASTSNPPAPTTIIATAEPPARTKKPVFIVKIRRPVTREQFHSAKPFTDPEPLPVPITTKSRTRRRGSMTFSDIAPPSLRKSRIKQYPTPPIYYADDDDDSGDDTSSSSVPASSSSSSASSTSGEYDNSENDSGERGGGNGGGGGGGGLPVKSDPDSSYVFGYETSDSNRLEKADPYGNVRGSYSYIGSSSNKFKKSRRSHSPFSSAASHLHHRRHIVNEPMRKTLLLRRVPRKSKRSFKSIVDPEGVKRTVHYIAGGSTGFQVIHASPSVSRGVRLEAPPGYVVKRVPSLRTSESRYPIPITVPQPSAIVYHIHPDSGWKPWEPTLRKKKVKIHRKKLPKALFENARRDGIVLLQTHPDIPSAQRSRSFRFPDVTSENISQNQNQNQYQTLGSASTSTLGVSAGNPKSGTGAYFKEKITAAGSGAVTQKETKLPYASRRRHAPQRGYTAEPHIVHITEDDSKERISASSYSTKHSKSPSSSSSSPQSSSSSSKSQGVHEREPLLYSPTFETMRDGRMPLPNPIQLQPTQVAIKNRGAPSQTVAGAPGLDTSSSNHNPVAFSSSGKLQVDVPTVIIEQIEAKPSSSLSQTQHQQHQQPQQQQQQAQQQKFPETAAVQVISSPGQQVGSQNNYIQGSSAPISTSNPVVTYQPSSVSAPTPPSASSSTPSVPQQKTVLQQNHAPSNNQISTSSHRQHQQQQQQQQLQPQQQQQQQQPVAPPQQTRTRRRHHRSKSSGTSSSPTSPASSSSSRASASSSNSKSNNSANAIKNAGVVETTTNMSSSKRLINRLAPTDLDTSATTQQ